MADIITDPDRARRKARAIVSDILVYNEDQVKEGIENDSLFDVLQEQIEEGRELYNSLVAPEVLTQHNFFDHALVDMLVKAGGKYQSRIW